jgi:molybdate transport system substrate-binding protein
MTRATAVALSVFSTLSAKEALSELVPRFESDTGRRVNVRYAGGSVLSRELVSGAEGDLLIGPDEFTGLLVSKGVLAPRGRAALVRSTTGLAVRASTALPDIGSVERLIALLRSAASVSYSAGASGIHFAELLERHGLAADIAPKTVMPAAGEMVGDVVARGGAEIGVQQVSELLPVAGLHILELPPQFQQTLTYAAVPFAKTSRHDEIGRFVDYLRSEAARPAWRLKGLQPIDNEESTTR